MSKQTGKHYLDSVYNSVNPEDLAASQKKIEELNTQLNTLIRKAQDLNTNTNDDHKQPCDSSRQNVLYAGSTNMMLSMNNLEKDLEIFKSIYDEELKLLRLELEDLSSFNNKLSLTNFNLESKLQDFIVKFEEIKKTNQSLTDELTEAKASKNKLEFDFENKKLELEKSDRENKQFKKDIEDLLNKLNEKQQMLDNQISYNQELELKLKELNNASVFQKKLSDKEIESLRIKLKSSHDTLSQLDFNNKNLNEQPVNDRFRPNSNVDLNRSFSTYDSPASNRLQLGANTNSPRTKSSLGDVVNKLRMSEQQSPRLSSDDEANQFKNLKFENAHLVLENKSLYDKNSQLENLCREMENMISILESSVKSVYNYQTNEEINYTNETVTKEKLIPIGPIASHNLAHKLRDPRFTHDHPPPLPLAPSVLMTRGGVNNNAANNNLEQNKKSSLPVSTSSTMNNNDTSSKNVDSKANLNVKSASLRDIKKELERNAQANKNCKDYTKDLFNSFERTTLIDNDSTQNNASVCDNAITEASYTGNVKIHEVNKNGYYIRLLNVSSNIDEDLGNYTIQQMVSTMPVAIFRFPSPLKIRPGHTLTVWARTDEVEEQPPHTFVWSEQEKWGTGPECTTILAKPNGQAVSWTTGCHKYGNIDYDEIIPLYPNKRNRLSLVSTSSSPIQLNRQKLEPKTIYSPTRHPHGSGSKMLADASNESKAQQDNATFRKSFFDTKQQQQTTANKHSSNGFMSSSSLNKKSSTNQRPQTAVGISSNSSVRFNDNNKTNETDQVYQESFSYFNYKIKAKNNNDNDNQQD